MGKDRIPAELLELRRIYMGFTASRVLLTANRLELFDHLRTWTEPAALARRRGLDPRALGILLDALAGIGVLRKSRKGTYRNTPMATRYLVRGARDYQGDIIRHASAMWESWSKLDEVVRSGRPAPRSRDLESFILGMHNLSRARTAPLLAAIGLKGVRDALDLGGGPGTNAMGLARRGIRTTLFDLPETVAIARRVVRREGVKGIRFRAGDFFADGIGSGYDLILVSQILHMFSAEKNVVLLRKCRGALKPGGRVVVQEFPIDPGRTSPPASALFSVNMLVATEGGRCYTADEIGDWLRRAGFSRLRTQALPETVLVEGSVP